MTAGYTKKNPGTIKAMFGSIASDYDKGNAVLSFQMHRVWNSALVKKVLMPEPPQHLLDLCAGTGDIAYNYLRRCKGPVSATLLDFSPEMLACAKEKSGQFPGHTLEFIEGDAQDLPFGDNTFDAVTIAYGIRNVAEPERCFREVLRVLKPGGRFGILELTQPGNPVLKAGHCLYLNAILPLLGKWVARDKQAYQYLCNSIQAFTPPQEVADKMQRCGFSAVTVTPLMGGIATILSAKK